MFAVCGGAIYYTRKVWADDLDALSSYDSESCPGDRKGKRPLKVFVEFETRPERFFELQCRCAKPKEKPHHGKLFLKPVCIRSCAIKLFNCAVCLVSQCLFSNGGHLVNLQILVVHSLKCPLLCRVAYSCPRTGEMTKASESLPAVFAAVGRPRSPSNVAFCHRCRLSAISFSFT